MKGGNFLSQYTSACACQPPRRRISPQSPPPRYRLANPDATTDANYLLKCLQGFNSKGVSVYAISIQNEPENSNPTYPTCKFTAAQEAAVGRALRSAMNGAGFSGTKIVGYDHNWSDAAGYPVQLVRVFSFPSRLRSINGTDANGCGDDGRCSRPQMRSRASRSTAIPGQWQGRTRSIVHTRRRRFTSRSARACTGATGGATSRCALPSSHFALLG